MIDNLENISTTELVKELAKREDLGGLLLADGLVPPNLWNIRVKLGAISCVDGVIIRKNGEKIEGGVIRRGTGKFIGKLAFLGGVVALHESVEDAMKRHFKKDLNLDIILPYGWDHPVLMRQYTQKINGQNKKDFCFDPSKHSLASTHIVNITGSEDWKPGEKIGGIEAQGLEWYTRENCPPEEDWGYDMRSTFLEVLVIAENITGVQKP